MGTIQHKTLAATLPDLIKKTAAHKLVWEIVQYAYPVNPSGYYFYKTTISGGFNLELNIENRTAWVEAGDEVDKFTYELTLSHDSTHQVVGDLDSKHVDSHTKKMLKRLYTMVTKMYPPEHIEQGTLVKSFHRILRAL